MTHDAYDRGYLARFRECPRSNPFWIQMDKDFTEWYAGWDDADYTLKNSSSPMVTITRDDCASERLIR